MSDVIEVVPISETGSEPGVPDWGEAVRLLEQATKAGNQDPHALYLLAMAYKHLGRRAEARHLLSKIAEPDANVLLQRGLLAHLERDYAAAAEQFQASWDRDPASYAAAYNLMLARLSQGQTEACVGLLDRLAPLAPVARERRFLELLRGLLGHSTSTVTADQEALLASLSADEEGRLLDMILGLGTFTVVFMLLTKLVALRPTSEAAYRAYVGAALVQAKGLVDRCQWSDAAFLLAPLKRRLEASPFAVEPMVRLSLYSLLGVCANLEQDFERGLGYFKLAQESFQRDFGNNLADPKRQTINSQGISQAVWLEQNLALTLEWMGRLDQAEMHWNRTFDLLEACIPRSLPPEHVPNLAFEGMSRLADLFARKEKWNSAVHFLQRAHRVRPTDYETMERLFHLYTQLKRTEEARKILSRLRSAKPNDPQAELFELEVREARKIEDVEQLLADVRRLLTRFPGDTRVEERAAVLTNNLVPTLERLADSYASQVNKVLNQMQRLPSYQINWPTVREIAHDLEDRYLQLRKLAQRCQAHVNTEDARRDLNRLVAHCDRKIDQCRSLGE